MKTKLFLLFTAILIINLNAQQRPGRGGAVIEGRVLEVIDSKPMEFANIVLFSSEDSSQVTGTITNESGYFKLENVRRGNYYLRASFIGFDDKFIESVVVKGPNTIDLGDISLAPKSYGVDDVVVSGERAPISYEIDKKVINVSEQFTATSGTAIEVLENVPSITVDIEGNVSLRGSGNFTVLIDGRPTILEASEALQQIPASAIENIEIITNPSAKYDPEGTAGIINIVMKKSDIAGMSGILDLNGGLNDKYGAELLLDYKTSSFQSNLGIDYNNRLFDMTDSEENWTENSGTRFYTNSNGTANRGRESFSLRGSIAHNFTRTDILTLGARYRDRESIRNSTLGYEEWSSTNPNIEFYNSISDRSRGGYSYSVFGNYLHNFGSKGHELIADFDFDYDNSDEKTLSELMQSGQIVSGRKTTESGPGKEFRGKLDYTLPLDEESKFEAGYQGEIDLSEERTGLFNFDSTAQGFVEDPQFSNNTKYDKNEQAIYTMYSNKLGSFGFQFGFRTEYTGRSITLVKTADEFKIDRWDYFPSAHFSYEIVDNHQVMTSYTRRINRPRGWELEPFETWIDAYNVRTGNPALDPEYIDSYEMGYQTFLGKFLFSVEGYYRITNNKIERIRSVYDDNITLSSVDNIGKDYSLGTELFLNFDPIQAWNVNLMGNLYDYKIEGAFNNTDFSRSSFNWSIRFNNGIKIGKLTQIQVNSIYNSPTVSSQGRVEDFFYANFAIKHEFFDKMLSATLQVRDIFGTAKREYTYEGEDFYRYAYFTRESPMIMLNLRFNINNYKSERRNGESGGMDMGDGGDF